MVPNDLGIALGALNILAPDLVLQKKITVKYSCLGKVPI
jgi:hypothetical protein